MYSMKNKFEQLVSLRPVMEIIVVPDSINMAEVGVCRVQADVHLYCAMLLVVRAVVSVAQMEVALENTNPYGFVVVANRRVDPAGLRVVGRPLNWTMPAPSVPELVPSVQYSVEEVATREPTHDCPTVPEPVPTQPEVMEE